MDVTIACPCPGTPHAEDTVTLRAVMDFPTAVLLQKTIEQYIVVRITDARDDGKERARLSEPDVMALMSRFYVRHCIEAWTLADDKGKALPVTEDNVETYIEANLDAALTIAEAAEDAYLAVTLPLAKRVVSRYVPTPTARPTSQKKRGSPQRPRRSKPSSISTIPTVVTGPTSSLPDGVSSSLPSSATAA